ncbi:MAG: YqeG family HAD IIIA-type phosphatase [Armatimonadetes bacterium]|nr:YqeG family HAD IIIA-type phosphatase [Armatimonadota bacterium]
MRPDLLVHAIEEIDLDWLHARGVRGLLLDVDNTILAWRSRTIPDAKRAWIEAAKRRFRVCLLSNTIFMDRIRYVSRELGVDFVARAIFGRKPWSGGFRAALRKLGLQPQEAAMIGDQVFSDILGGNCVGCITVLVDPVDPRSEFIVTRLVRYAEAPLRRKWWQEWEEARAE